MGRIWPDRIRGLEVAGHFTAVGELQGLPGKFEVQYVQANPGQGRPRIVKSPDMVLVILKGAMGMSEVDFLDGPGVAVQRRTEIAQDPAGAAPLGIQADEHGGAPRICGHPVGPGGQLSMRLFRLVPLLALRLQMFGGGAGVKRVAVQKHLSAELQVIWFPVEVGACRGESAEGFLE